MALKGFSSEFAVLRWLNVPHNTVTLVFYVHLFKNQPNNRENTYQEQSLSKVLLRFHCPLHL